MAEEVFSIAVGVEVEGEKVVDGFQRNSHVLNKYIPAEDVAPGNFRFNSLWQNHSQVFLHHVPHNLWTGHTMETAGFACVIGISNVKGSV